MWKNSATTEIMVSKCWRREVAYGHRQGTEKTVEISRRYTLVEVLVYVLKHFERDQPGFMERYCDAEIDAWQDNTRRTRMYVARDYEDLNLNRPDFARKYSRKILGKYWINTNIGRKECGDILRLACEVAGAKLHFGKWDLNALFEHREVIHH